MFNNALIDRLPSITLMKTCIHVYPVPPIAIHALTHLNVLYAHQDMNWMIQKNVNKFHLKHAHQIALNVKMECAKVAKKGMN